MKINLSKKWNHLKKAVKERKPLTREDYHSIAIFFLTILTIKLNFDFMRIIELFAQITTIYTQMADGFLQLIDNNIK